MEIIRIWGAFAAPMGHNGSLSTSSLEESPKVLDLMNRARKKLPSRPGPRIKVFLQFMQSVMTDAFIIPHLNK
jgi:hypothetical protein